MKLEDKTRFISFIDKAAEIETFYHAYFTINPHAPMVTVSKFGRDIPPEDMTEIIRIAKGHGMEMGLVNGEPVFGFTSNTSEKRTDEK
jgi:hypothetical protein